MKDLMESRRVMSLDANKLHASIQDEVLLIEVPQVNLRGPLVSAEAREEILEKTGLKPFEVDYLIDDLYDSISDRATINFILASRT